MKWFVPVLLFISLVSVTPAVLAADLKSCVAIQIDTDRLACFDLAMKDKAGEPVDAKDEMPKIIQLFQDAGINLSSISLDPPPAEGSPLPRSYDTNWSFVDDDLNNGKGGQIFICSKKKYCDPIFDYFDAFKALAGPYLFRNDDGTIVAQLNSGHRPDSADRYEKVLSEN